MLAAGSKLGPYEVLGQLGAGGMGEVYRARDTRLAREVALKILPESSGDNDGRFRRFQTEARAAAALSHPNIVAVHDIGQEAGTPYIVSELLTGGTLTRLLDRGPLPVRRLLDLAVPMAEALAAAHANGIVHRDLKPDNLLLSADGSPKIADFGLAKYFAREPVSGSQHATVSDDRTREGTIIGTVGYMSPEQAEGKDVDYRSDQFSFGSVLYEIATGRRAFHGKSTIDTLAAIVNEEPDPIEKVNPKVPMPLRWIIQRCHAKEPSRRYDSTGDLARELAIVRDHIGEMSGAAPGTATVTRRRPLLAALTIAAALAGLAGMFLVGRSTAERPHPTFQQLTFRRGAIGNARFGPDGRTVVFSASFDGATERIYTLHPGRPEWSALNLPQMGLFAVSHSGELAVGTVDASMDGWGGVMLARVPLSGGSPRSILTDVGSADWAPDGETLAVTHRVGGRRRLEFPIGQTVYESTGGVVYPRVAPRGDRVAFVDFPVDTQTTGSVMLADASAVRAISKNWFDLGSLAWSPDSSEVWFSASKTGFRKSLWAVTLSGRLRLLTETPGSSMIQDVSQDGAVLITQFSLRGFISAMVPGETTARDLTWLDFSFPTDLSGDGKTLLFQEWGEAGGTRGAVYLRGLDDSPPIRLGEGFGLRLSPDKKWVLSRLFTSPPRLVLLPTGAGETRTLPVEGPPVQNAFWFPDGKRVLLVGGGPGKSSYSVLDVETAKTRALASSTLATFGAISPDGRLLARWGEGTTLDLLSLETGDALPARGAEPGEFPIRWSPDGRILYVFRREGMFNVITRVDPFTGKREAWKRIQVSPDPVGLRGNNLPVFLSADGQTCVWAYQRYNDELYLVEGLK